MGRVSGRSSLRAPAPAGTVRVVSLARAAAADPAWRYVLLVWATSRLYFLLVGAASHAFLPEAAPGGWPLEPPGVLNYWAHWDGGWYSAIASVGYANVAAPSSAAFFPLYPALIWLGTQLGGGPALWGVLISTTASLFAFYFVYRIAEHLRGAEVARVATLALAVFPTAFFLNAVYSEALFIALTAGAIWAARVREDLILAAFFGYFATMTRNVGILLVIPLAAEWWRHRRSGASLFALAMVPGGLLAFNAYLWRQFGDPFLSSTAQLGWGRQVRNPIETLQNAWITAVNGAKWALHPVAMFETSSPEPAFKAADTYNLALFVVFTALIVLAFWALPKALAAYSFLLVLAPVLTPSFLWPLTSLSRYLLAPFPLFVVLAVGLARSRVALVVWLAFSVSLATLLTMLFTTWRWVA
jgi:hypothetical protein